MITQYDDTMMVTMTVGQLRSLTEQVVNKAVHPLMERIDTLQDAMRTSNDDMVYGYAEICKRLGVSDKTLKNAIHDGKLKGVLMKFGGKYRARKSDLDKVNV